MFPDPPRPTETNLLEEPSFSRKEMASEASVDGCELRPTDGRRMFPEPPLPDDMNESRTEGSRSEKREDRGDWTRAMENAEREGDEVGDVTQGGLKGVARASGLALFKLVGTGADFTAGETGRPIRILLAPKSDQVGHMSSSNGLRYPYLFMSVFPLLWTLRFQVPYDNSDDMLNWSLCFAIAGLSLGGLIGVSEKFSCINRSTDCNITEREGDNQEARDWRGWTNE